MTPAAPEPSITALLVLGMHRSGTSAAAGSLAQLGVELGDRLIDAADDNRKGYWEHADAVAINDALLAGIGRSWDDVRALPDGWMQSSAAAQARPSIGALLREFAGSPLWALKDPRLCRLAPLWLEGMAEAGQQAACLLVLRHPEEVAASLFARDGLPILASQLLWARHVLDSVRATRLHRRHMISFNQLLSAPAECLSQAADRLGLRWPMAQGDGIRGVSAFLDVTERHQSVGEAAGISPSPMSGFVARLYARCLDQTAGDGDWASIEAMGDELDAADALDRGWIEAIGAMQQSSAQRAARALARRSDEIAGHLGQIVALEVAKGAAEALALQRQDELQAYAKALSGSEERLRTLLARVQQHEVALARAESLVHASAEDHRKISDALAAATSLALSRLTELETLAAALKQAESTAMAQLSQLSARDQRIAELASRPTREELDDAMRRATECEAMTVRLEAMLAASDRTIGEREASLRALGAEIAQMKASLSWRITAPFRRNMRRQGEHQ